MENSCEEAASVIAVAVPVTTGAAPVTAVAASAIAVAASVIAVAASAITVAASAIAVVASAITVAAPAIAVVASAIAVAAPAIAVAAPVIAEAASVTAEAVPVIAAAASRHLVAVPSPLVELLRLRMIAQFRAHGITGWRRRAVLFGKPDLVFPRDTVSSYAVLTWDDHHLMPGMGGRKARDGLAALAAAAA